MVASKKSVQDWAKSFRHEKFIKDFPLNAKYIPLTRGLYAIVDETDYEWLNQWKWCADKKGYAVRGIILKNGKTKIIKMHRLIMNAPDGADVDHINGKFSDNRRCNLRLCSRQQNLQNRKGYKNKKSCKYKGVYKSKKKWQVLISVNKKLLHIGMYSTSLEGAIAYDKAAIKYHKEFALLNFPKGQPHG